MNEIDEIERASLKVQFAAKVLNKLFLTAFLIALVLSLVFLMLTIEKGIEDFSSNRIPSYAIAIGKIGFELFLMLFMLWVPASIFRDISRGESPFTSAQANRLKIAAILLVFHSLFSLLMSPAILNVAGLDGAVVGLAVGSASSEVSDRIVPINVGDIVLAIVLFCAALIVEYGSLLQKLSDDTL